MAFGKVMQLGKGKTSDRAFLCFLLGPVTERWTGWKDGQELEPDGKM